MKDLTDNEVLADFVGKRLEKPSKGYDQQWELPMCEGYYPSVNNLEFDKRWERIMPVWYKFNDLGPWDNMKDMRKYTWFCSDIEHAILHQGPTPSEACKLLANAIRWYQSVNK
jgi:hypothetical protein